jgi:Leucine-rich repeat (LRR) protein
MATFITSKADGQFISLDIETTVGYWKYLHDGVWSEPFETGSYSGSSEIEITNENGEFTLVSCDFEGTETGDITYLDLNKQELTSFDGTGLTSLTYLDLNSNQLTEFDGTPLTSLTELYLNSNQLTEFDGTPLTSLTDLYLNNNQLTEFDGTGLTSLTYLNLGTQRTVDENQLTSFDGTGLTSLTELYLYSNQLTEFDGTGLTSLTYLDLGDNQLTEFDGTDLTSLLELYLSGNQLTTIVGFLFPTSLTNLHLGSSKRNLNNLTSVDLSSLVNLTNLNLNGNQLTTLDISNMDYLQNLYVNNGDLAGLLTPSVNNSLLAKLAANELSNDWDSGKFYTTGGRTSGGTDDYDYLINEGWTIEGADLILTPTFITSKADGQFISLDIETTVGYWKYLHDGVWSEPFETGSYSGSSEIEITNENGEFTLVSCDFEGTETGDITYLTLNYQELTSFDGTGLTSLLELDLSGNQLTEFDGTDLYSLTFLGLEGNQLTTLDISNMDYLQNLYVNDNLLTPSVNNSLLAKLAANELANEWDSGEFYTTGGRTSAGTDDYDYLINEGWKIEGADLPPVWYRFKAPSTEPWDGTIGVDGEKIIKEIWFYQSNGFTYYDFLTSQSIGEVKFNVQGTETEIIATQVPVTFNEFSSSGSFTAAIGFGGNAIGYANIVGLGSWGTLNSGTIPAIPSRYEGDLAPGSVIFSDVLTEEGNFCLISAPILMSLTVNGNSIDLTGVNGNPTGTNVSSFGFAENDVVSFSITWGELVETPVSRKLRVRGINQQN